MGIDLLLLPFMLDNGDLAYAYTTLELERRSDLWRVIRSLPSEPVPPRLETLVSIEGPEGGDDWALGNTQTDRYGEPLVCVQAGSLKALQAHPLVQDHWRNQAAWAYLSYLPDQTRVAIYWA